MTREKLLYVCFTILICLTSCVSDYRIKRPVVPLCIVLEKGDCFCSSSEGDFPVPKCAGYISTDPKSYDEMEKYVDSLELRLLNCLNFPKKCK
jgi:hypothetical protein